MRIEYYGYSHIGGKKENEDSYGVKEYDNGVIAVVADGLGSHGGGRQASETAVKYLMQCGGGMLPDKETIMSGLWQANSEILEKRENENHMKTTVVFFSVYGNRAVWAHIGDSRLYHYYNYSLCGYTLDHSVSQMAVALGEIDRSHIPFHADRSRLLRVLGDNEIKPEIHDEIALDKGFHAFLMCTDGFWEYVTEDEMLLDLHKSQTPSNWINAMQLRHEKRVKGDHDNNTAIAVYVYI